MNYVDGINIGLGLIILGTAAYGHYKGQRNAYHETLGVLNESTSVEKAQRRIKTSHINMDFGSFYYLYEFPGRELAIRDFKRGKLRAL